VKNKKIFLILIVLGFIAYSFYDYKSKSKSFVVTPNTKIDPNSELAKYVTQEEINAFAMRYWNFDEEDEKIYDENATQKELRHLLKYKKTDEVLNYLKEKNLNANVKLRLGTTPLMYSAFYDDIETAKELINLGADIREKDAHNLSPMAYAIGRNNISIVKLLLDAGVKFEEVDYVQWLRVNNNKTFNINSVEIDKNGSIVLGFKNIDCFPYCEVDEDTGKKKFEGVGYGYMFSYAIYSSYELTKLILDTGYKPKLFHDMRIDYNGIGNSLDEIYTKEELDEIKSEFSNNFESFVFRSTLFNGFITSLSYEPTLNLLLEHNITYEPSKEFLKKEYDECYNNLAMRISGKQSRVTQYQFERKRYITEKDYDFEINVGLEHCFDKNGTFDGLVEYIKYKNNMNKAKHITHILREKEQTITPKPYRVLSKDEIENFCKDGSEIGRDLYNKSIEKIRKENELKNKGVTNVSTRK